MDIADVPVRSEKTLRLLPREVLVGIKNAYPIAVPGSTYSKADGTDVDSLIREILRCQELLGSGESVSPRFLSPGDRIVAVVKGVKQLEETFEAPEIAAIAMEANLTRAIAVVQDIAIVPQQGLTH